MRQESRERTKNLNVVAPADPFISVRCAQTCCHFLSRKAINSILLMKITVFNVSFSSERGGGGINLFENKNKTNEKGKKMMMMVHRTFIAISC
jgi:hypothetical protein